MVNLHITRGELTEILTEQLVDNSRNSRGLPGGYLYEGAGDSCDLSESNPYLGEEL